MPDALIAFLAQPADYVLDGDATGTASAVKQQTAADNDKALVSATLEGDNAAFITLIKAHDTSLRKMVAGVLLKQDAVDDVLQEAYVKAYRALPTFKQTSSFKTWIFRIAYNTAIDELRRSKRDQHDVIDESSHASYATPEIEISGRIDLLAALATLTLPQRAAVLLIDGHGFGYRYVAQLLNIPVGTVAYNLHEARRSLRRMCDLPEEGSK